MTSKETNKKNKPRVNVLEDMDNNLDIISELFSYPCSLEAMELKLDRHNIDYNVVTRDETMLISLVPMNTEPDKLTFKEVISERINDIALNLKADDFILKTLLSSKEVVTMYKNNTNL